MMLALADAFPGAPLVYDCMDDLASFAFAPAGMREREQALMQRAGVVFCGGRTLYERRRERARNVQLFASGVEFERFSEAREIAPHPVTAAVPSPRYGYVGVVDERLDLALIESLAGDPSEPNVFLIGPVVKIDPAVLPRRKNVHFTGFMPYASLPSILAGLDIALMPFAHNESTRSISPTKTLEYLAAGIPVVSTGIADVVRDYEGIVAIGEGADFVRACTLARDPARIGRGVERAREHGWDAIAESMWREVSSLEAPRSAI